MSNDLLITHFTAQQDGVMIQLSRPGKLKGSSFSVKEVWVSWDKIGKALFEGYADGHNVAELEEIRERAQEEADAQQPGPECLLCGRTSIGFHSCPNTGCPNQEHRKP